MKHPNHKLSPRTVAIICLITCLTIVIAFALSIPYRKQLFNLSLYMIDTLQQQTSGPIMTAFQNLVTFYAGTEGTFILMVMAYVLSYDKINMIVVVLYICANVYVMAFLKVLFVDPRPYVVDSLVKNLEWKCEITYGFPSGHTWILLLLHEPIVTDLFGCGPFKIGLSYCLLLAIFVPWSRMYLGSHSADQLINGLFYSLAFLVLYRFYFRQKIFKLVGYFLNPSDRKRKFLTLLTIHIILLIPPIILYQINTVYRDIDMGEFYKTNEVCHVTKFTYEQKMGNQISDTAIGNVLMGFMYGFMLLREKYGNEQNSISKMDFLLGYWQFRVNKIKNFLIKKFLLYLTSVFFTAGITYLLIGLFIKNFYLTYFLKVVAWNAMIIIWIRIIPQISIRYKLIQSTSQSKQSMVQVND